LSRDVVFCVVCGIYSSRDDHDRSDDQPVSRLSRITARMQQGWAVIFDSLFSIRVTSACVQSSFETVRPVAAALDVFGFDPQEPAFPTRLSRSQPAP
jgi:hypothetical protein